MDDLAEVQCDHCGGLLRFPPGESDALLATVLHDYLAEHAQCDQTYTFDLPLQRTQLGSVQVD